MFLKEFQYIEKERKVIRYNTDGIECSSDDSDKANSDKEDKKNSNDVLFEGAIYISFFLNKCWCIFEEEIYKHYSFF